MKFQIENDRSTVYNHVITDETYEVEDIVGMFGFRDHVDSMK